MTALIVFGAFLLGVTVGYPLAIYVDAHLSKKVRMEPELLRKWGAM